MTNDAATKGSFDPGNSADETIRVITTGGTIDKIYFDAKSTYHVGPPQIAEMLTNFNVAVAFSVEAIFSKDSLDLTDDDRAKITQHVGRATEKRILITHGTDS
ncbi:MAG: hypothetical protein HKN13_08495, partial [Rhodothermales bacterium]|nr:hypothetical protein [Rhodothermales bacterium]